MVDLLLDEGLYLRRVPQHFTYPRDPKDEPQLNLAIEVKADYIVSRDKDSQNSRLTVSQSECI